MKNKFLHFILLFLLLSLFACSQEKGISVPKTLVTINDYILTLDEFEYQLAAELELDQDFKLTRQAKTAFLEQLIRKELLLQEAKNLKLDRKEKFVRAIERYWESTLIRDLIDLKSKEISKKAYVQQNEIEAHYQAAKESNKDLPLLDSYKERITNDFKEKKKSRMLEEWISELRKNAAVMINDDLL